MPLLEDMLARIEKPGERPLAVRPSSLDLFWSCPRKYWFAKVLRIFRKRPEVSVACSIGSAYHLIMQHTVKSNLNILEGIRSASAEKETRCSALEESAAAAKNIIDQETFIAAIDNLRKTFDVACGMAQTWWTRYPPSYKPEDILLVEEKLSAFYETLGIQFEGTPDLVVAASDDPTWAWIVDYKSCGTHPLRARAGRHYGLQTRIYRWLVDQRIAPRRVAGVLYQYIRQPTIRLKRKETLPEYIERCAAWYDEAINTNPEGASYCFLSEAHRFFDEESTRYGKVSLARDEELLALLAPLTAAKAPSDFTLWPRRRPACFTYNRECPYLCLCESSPKVWSSYLADRFEQVDDASGADDEEPEEGGETSG